MRWLPSADRSSRLRRRWHVRVLAHRRPLAALCAAGAVVAVVLALRPVGPPTAPLLVAARDLPAGAVLDAAEDLVPVRAPRDLVPAGAADAPSGRTLASPVRRGEPITDARLLTPDLMAGYPGLVGVTVRVPDPAVAHLLAAGDVVDVLATDPADGRTQAVASGATVVALPPDPPGPTGAGGVPAGRAVLLGVREDEVSPVSVAAVSGFISVVFRH